MAEKKGRHKWTFTDEVIVFMSSESDRALAERLGISHGSIHARRWNAAYALSEQRIGLRGGAESTREVCKLLGIENAGKPVLNYLIKTLVNLVDEVGATRQGKGPKGEPEVYVP
jgi:hypothetical protein